MTPPRKHDPPNEYYFDEHGRCPRCGRLMNTDERDFAERDGKRALGAIGPLWGYLPDASRKAFATLFKIPERRWVPCGAGQHFISESYWTPELDGPFEGYGDSLSTSERDTPIYSDYDEEAGF